MAIITVFDATHTNISSLPRGVQVAGYTTGSSDIRWTTQDWKTHPNAIRICQDHGSDTTADILDMETNAAIPKDCAVWARKALDNFRNVRRPGQRMPAIYASASRITEVVNALISGGITSGIGLWVAHFGVSQMEAAREVANASGPFPMIGFQFRNTAVNDISVFDSAWLGKVSRMASKVIPEVPPGEWSDANKWDWKQVMIGGVGMDGRMHLFVYNPDTGKWVKMA
jgi:hypothetical protein